MYVLYSFVVHTKKPGAKNKLGFFFQESAPANREILFRATQT